MYFTRLSNLSVNLRKCSIEKIFSEESREQIEVVIRKSALIQDGRHKQLEGGNSARVFSASSSRRGDS